jgi:uncharacterized membrane protein YfcA
MLLYLAIGLGAGVLSGLFGIGGGVVIVPALMLLARFETQNATGTSLGALLLPVGALGAYTYYRGGYVNVTASALLALGLLMGAGAGARIAVSLQPDLLRKMFAVFLGLIAIRVWFK